MKEEMIAREVALRKERDTALDELRREMEAKLEFANQTAKQDAAKKDAAYATMNKQLLDELESLRGEKDSELSKAQASHDASRVELER
jgi:hypothetical protein